MMKKLGNVFRKNFAKFFHIHLPRTLEMPEINAPPLQYMEWGAQVLPDN